MLKKLLLKIHVIVRKKPAWETLFLRIGWIFKLAAISFRKETPAQRLFCEY